MVLNLTAGMGGDLVLRRRRSAPLPLRETAPTWPARPSASRHVARLPARDLHARLRHHEFRRGRLRDDQHARHAAGDGPAR